MSAPAPQRSFADWASLMVLVACWGSTFAITKVAVETVTPLWVVCLRIWAALVVTLIALALRGEGLPRRRAVWAWLVPIALFSITPFFLISWGTQHIATGLGGILIGAVPLFVVGLAHFLVPGETTNLPRAGGVAVGFAGLVLLIGPEVLSELGGEGPATWAQLAIVGAALCYALLGVCGRIMPAASPFQKNAGSLMIAAAIALPLALVLEPDGLDNATSVSLGASAMVGILANGLAGIVMFHLLARTGPTFMSLSSYLIPVYAMVLGIIAFGERLEPERLAALGLILGGIGLSEWGAARRAAARQA